MQQRLNLSFTGIPTFAKVAYQPDLAHLDADVAIIGAPYDLGTQSRPGARYGPRAIRAASMMYGRSGAQYFDADLRDTFLEGVRIIDVGDVDMVNASPELCLRNIHAMITELLARGVLPVTIGGDHSVVIPILHAYRAYGPLVVLQIDAHLDFVDTRFGVREGNGNVMRRIAEMAHVDGVVQVGLRGPGSSDGSDFDDAIRMGSVIVGARELRRVGCEAVLDRVPDSPRYYVTIDADGFDASVMPGSGSPSPGGLSYYEIVDLLRGLALKGDVVGFDFVEVAPMYDPTEVTAQTAARVILDFLGAIFKARERRRTAGSEHVAEKEVP